MADAKIKDIRRLAVLIVEYRNGDVSNEDGSFATTDLNTIIRLEMALCEAFDTNSYDATMREIGPKIDKLTL